MTTTSVTFTKADDIAFEVSFKIAVKKSAHELEAPVDRQDIHQNSEQRRMR